MSNTAFNKAMYKDVKNTARFTCSTFYAFNGDR